MKEIIFWKSRLPQWINPQRELEALEKKYGVDLHPRSIPLLSPEELKEICRQAEVKLTNSPLIEEDSHVQNLQVFKNCFNRASGGPRINRIILRRENGK